MGDRSGDGVISEAEFLASMERQDVTEFLEALNIGTDDAANIFTLLDRNGDGLVDIVEFVTGMEKLRGQAKSSDLQLILLQNQKVMDTLRRMQGLPPGPTVVRKSVRRSPFDEDASHLPSPAL